MWIKKLHALWQQVFWPENPPENHASDILRALNSSTWEVRKLIIDMYGRMQCKEVIDDIIPCLNDEERYVRIATISALSRMKDEQTIPYLAKMLDDPDEHIRYETVISLKHFISEASGKALLQALEDSSEMIRLAAIDAIADIHYTPALDLLKSMKDKEFDDVYFAIDEAIRKLEQ